MTDDELEEIRGRLEAATPGPWWVNPNEPYRVGKEYGNMKGVAYVDIKSLPDAGFIAHAPTDIRALLDEVRKQAVEIGTLAESRKWALGKVGSLEKTLDDINDILTIPAAEYVPAIGDVFKRIDKERGHD